MKTRTIVLAVILLALSAAASVSAQTTPLHVRQFGSDDYDYATKTVTDPEGNVYVAGMTTGVIDSPGASNVNSGGADIFVAKFDPSGTLLWATQFGSSSEDGIGGIALGSPS
ncbi:MAG TPA: SBBP repeat-containing protein, partial [Syntrophales bacterium]|nr:SBBP repeat-containing protein [Syntrophales bacterium]